MMQFRNPLKWLDRSADEPTVTDRAAAPIERENPAEAPPDPAADLRYLARQPILDQQGRVHAYDLLFRNAPQAISARPDEAAVETMLDNEVLFGLERLTNGLPAFFACNADALTGDLVLMLTPELTILAVPASLEPTSKLIEACRALKARGFRLALDDFAWHERLNPLVECVDYIRVDFRRFGGAEQQQFFDLGIKSFAMVAQKVEIQDDFRQAVARGFTYFQGDYFCHPVLLAKRKVPANRLFHFEIVRELYREPIDIRKIAELVRRDASLTYRLLRLVNSPIYALRQEVRSVETAIMILGEITFRRTVSVALLSELNSEQPTELLQLALTRARFCEASARQFGQDASEQYLLGMFSLLPAMLAVPMEEILPSLPLRSQVCEALTGILNPERAPLTWIESHVRGDWGICDQIAAGRGLTSTQLMPLYEEALVWAASASPAAS
jgi:EAL and modified HD-GYP domain-containing signal transduction protein